MRVCMNYLAKRSHSMLASVARVSFRFRRTENLDYERVLFLMNVDERISDFFSSAVYLPLRLCIYAQKRKVFSHTYVYWVGCSVRRAYGYLSTAKTDRFDWIIRHKHSSRRKETHGLAKKRNCVKSGDIKNRLRYNSIGIVIKNKLKPFTM